MSTNGDRRSGLPVWLDQRGAGILLHPTSLPSETGIGTMGADMERFLDFAAEAGMAYWQVCPVGPTGYGDSPYQCFSAFAGNPYLIDLESLVGFGLLKQNDFKFLTELPVDRVDYGALYEHHGSILKVSFERFQEQRIGEISSYGSFDAFKSRNSDWLNPYASYMALKFRHGSIPWPGWDKRFGSFATFSAEPIDPELEAEIEEHRFVQYLFFGQWRQIRAYAESKNIWIIGDAPLFVALDSADVWAHREMFTVSEEGRSEAVAGVPPDYFSKEGQLWGNPLYDWNYLRENDFDWWLRRIEINFELFDVLRLDHFRGFSAYWRIPADSDTAEKGKWIAGPGLPFFEAVKRRYPAARLIAEDLGLITPKVRKLRLQTGLPGMAVLQFAFVDDPNNPYLPHNLDKNTVLYSGTHDNDTTLGWYRAADPHIRDQVRRYLRISGDEISWDFIRAAYHSVSRLAVVTPQDLLNLDSEGRMNRPGRPDGNWQWRCTREQLEGLT